MPIIAVTLSAQTIEGQARHDPVVPIEVREIGSGIDRVVNRTSIKNFAGSETFTVQLEEFAQPLWQMTADFSLFDAGHVFSFFPAVNRTPEWTVRAARLPNKWRPVFIPLGTLASPRFDRLKEVIRVSSNVDLKNGEAVGDLDAAYDSLSSPAEILAKAALLNVYAVLIEELDPEGSAQRGSGVPWFAYVRKIVRLDQERFVAEVDSGLFENVNGILNQLAGKYARQGYSTEPAADFPLHYPNIPAQYGGNGVKRPVDLVQMITLKKRYRQGDVQLTVSFFRFPDGTTVHLLDCDTDEHDNIVGHSFDLLRHLLEHTGTNPIYMHEFIEEDSAIDDGGVATVDLGYTLEEV